MLQHDELLKSQVVPRLISVISIVILVFVICGIIPLVMTAPPLFLLFVLVIFIFVLVLASSHHR